MSGLLTSGRTFGCIKPPLGPAHAIVRDLLVRSTERDPDEDVDQVLGEIEQGDALLWVTHEGPQLVSACVTQFLETASGRQCFIRHNAGEIGDTHFLPIILDWAKSQGCTSAELTGRRGWARSLKPQGWHEKAVVLRIDL